MGFLRSPRPPQSEDKPATDEVVFVSEDVEFRLVWNLDPGPLGLPRRLVRACTRERVGALMEVDVLEPSAPRWVALRLEEEERMGVLLEHPAIARVHGLFEFEDGAFLLKEHVEGCGLDTVLDLAALGQRRMSEAFCLHVVHQVAGALHCANTTRDEEGRPLGLLHRSVSPGCIRVGLEGEVKLTEFAAAYSELPGRLRTPGGLIRGSLAYAAPERLESYDEEEVDERSDLFSLGVVLLELLTGKNLYGLESVERAANVSRPRLPPREDLRAEEASWASITEMVALADAFRPKHVEEALGAVSAPVKELVHRLLRIHPTERYATAARVRAVVRGLLEASGNADYGAPDVAREVLAMRTEAEQSPHRTEAMPTERGILPGRVPLKPG